MFESLTDPDLLRILGAYAVPTVFVLGALSVGSETRSEAGLWRRARTTAVLCATVATTGFLVSLGQSGGAGASSVPGLVQTSFQLLIAFVGLILTRYSATYLSGEPRQAGFVRCLLLTLAGSSLVGATDFLPVLWLAWLGTSLALGRLLVFYPERPAAQMAAHKKFLASRAADTCVATAMLLFFFGQGTVRLSVLASEPLGFAGQFAVGLIALAVLLKSAQLPVHGWLMQVMEAPTPVSALLHAGVVNLGGFVLIRTAPLLDQVPFAQALLVVAGTTTAVLAALVMTTRISIKVHLAWSTCAQMGFMVLQCGLGLYEMALLHLIAHSLYKAHAFLCAGGTVHRTRVKLMASKAVPPSVPSILLATLIAGAVAFAAGTSLGVEFGRDRGLTAMSVVVVLALVPLIVREPSPRPLVFLLRSIALAGGTAVAYFGLHALLHELVVPVAAPRSPLLAWFAGLAFAVLFVLQMLPALRRGSRFSKTERGQRLHALFHGGLFLDEWFTRLTLRVWPVRTEVLR